MPIISMFFGIIVRMYYQEHEPAHFHVEYRGQRAKFDFSGAMIAGDLKSGTARRLIRKWVRLHRSDLETNWQNMKLGRALSEIEPLD